MLETVRLPHGVTLPRNLAEDDARDLVAALATAYGWAYTLHGRAEVEAHLSANTYPRPAQARRLNTDEWDRLRLTAAWSTLAVASRHWVDHAAIIPTAITQGTLECARCTAALTGPPTATWGLCPPCLNTAELDELRNRPCPVTTDATAHLWADTSCGRCGLPAPTRTDVAASVRMPARQAA
ncbi:hypothetical protein [Nucisporomicrobium flavum]|uniref:hypothetical protein n=1 Tax=Nucisporomicrobium flavum TaxID=2785915 RepID=UPI0018F64BA6|nr:hypothetical protein [Nucisporomicrobium flavum]